MVTVISQKKRWRGGEQGNSFQNFNQYVCKNTKNNFWRCKLGQVGYVEFGCLGQVGQVALDQYGAVWLVGLGQWSYVGGDVMVGLGFVDLVGLCWLGWSG